MKLIQRISILITLLSANINYAQEFNGYKYFIIDNLMDSNDNYIKDYSEISEKVSDYFFKKKVLVLKNNKNESPRELNFNPCLGLLVRIVQIEKFLTLSFYNCKKEKIEAISGKWKYSLDALSQIFEGLDKMSSYYYD